MPMGFRVIALTTLATYGMLAQAATPVGTDVSTNAPSMSAIQVRIRPVTSGSPRLAIVMGNTDNHDYIPRLRAVHALGTDLSADEVKALFALLDRKDGEDALSADELNGLKNDVVNALKKQTKPPADLASNLAAMYEEASHDEVWRDYCIQHLGDCYPSIASSNDQAMARQVLWSAADAKGGTIPGTAMLALCGLAGRPGFDQGLIAAKALAMVKDEVAGNPGRMTALQVCARLGNRQVLPAARSLVGSSASVMLRISAIGCIGILGDASDKPLLEKQAASSDRRLRVAAESALKKLGKAKP